MCFIMSTLTCPHALPLIFFFPTSPPHALMWRDLGEEAAQSPSWLPLVVMERIAWARAPRLGPDLDTRTLAEEGGEMLTSFRQGSQGRAVRSTKRLPLLSNADIIHQKTVLPSIVCQVKVKRKYLQAGVTRQNISPWARPAQSPAEKGADADAVLLPRA